MSVNENYHVYFDTPPAIFKARVNMPSTSYPVTHITYDGVTLGAFADIIPDMTLLLGTTDGADNLGRVRVQNVATGTLIAVGRISQGIEDGTLDILDNAYITVLDDYRVWSKIPRMILDDDPDTPDVDTFKDSDIPVLSYNDEIPPKSNPGPFFADYIDPDTGVITVQFPKEGTDVSYAVAEGATITDYLWDVVDGTITVGTTTSAVITATFPAGRRWVGLTVTDSNGKVQTSRTFVLAVDPDDDVTYDHTGSELTFTLAQDGTKLDMVLGSPLPRNTYYDGCLVLVWQDSASSPGSRDHMRFVGWLQAEDWNLAASKQGLKRATTLHCVDIAGRLKELPGFPQALERSDEEIGWEYMPDLTMNRALNYLGAWHTTAWSLADVILPPTGDSYPAMRIDTSGGNIFDQLSSTSKKMVPAHILTCTPAGELIFVLDWMEIDIEDRPAAAQELTEDDIGQVSSSYNRQPKVHVLNTGAIQASTDWVIEDGEETLPLLFSKAPGDAFSQGTSDVLESEGIAIDQETLNKATGHRYARHNARYAPFSIDLANLEDVWWFIPAYMERIELTIGTEYAAQRGLDFTSGFGQLKQSTVRLQEEKRGSKISASLQWEYETFGNPGVTHIPEETEDPVDTTPDLPPGGDTPPSIPAETDMIAAVGIDGFVYRTEDFTSATPTWDRVDTGIADTIYTWVVDPFSPAYLTGVGNVNGWIVNDTGIYRVEGMFGTVDTTLVHTFTTPTSAASYHWRSIQASFGAFFEEGNPWLLCISYYGDTAGHTGTWALRSLDGGVTWEEEVQVSAHYANGIAQRYSPIGVYASPRTPGLAYTSAFIETAPLPLADGWQSTDWGETWTRMSAEVSDPLSLLPRWCLYDDDTSSFSYGSPSHIGSTVCTANDAPGGGTTEDGNNLIIAPHPDTHRLVIEFSWSVFRREKGLSSGTAGSVSDQEKAGDTDITSGSADIASPSLPSKTSDNGFDVSATSFGGGIVEWTKLNASDWPVNSVSVLTTPVTNPAQAGARLDMVAISSAVGASGVAILTFNVSGRVKEVELENGTIYEPPLYGDGAIQPGHQHAGTIHVPWQGNADESIIYFGYSELFTTRQFKLKRSVAGTISDVSPVDTISFGANRGHFAIRAYDGDKTYLVVCVMGNDTDLDASNDTHAVYVSDDEGATWTEVIAPVSDASAPSGRPAYEAAFSGDNPQVLYIWGPSNTMGYSDDLGATVQDKSGNLSSLGTAQFIGIAGGPTG